jgi:hypothetical protein
METIRYDNMNFYAIDFLFTFAIEKFYLNSLQILKRKCIFVHI